MKFVSKTACILSIKSLAHSVCLVTECGIFMFLVLEMSVLKQT
jgi:hypothetical protein